MKQIDLDIQTITMKKRLKRRIIFANLEYETIEFATIQLFYIRQTPFVPNKGYALLILEFIIIYKQLCRLLQRMTELCRLLQCVTQLLQCLIQLSFLSKYNIFTFNQFSQLLTNNQQTLHKIKFYYKLLYCPTTLSMRFKPNRNHILTRSLVNLLLLSLLIQLSQSAPFTDMVITSSNSQTQQLATYTFQIYLYDVPFIPSGSVIYMYFPNDYQNKALQTYSCLALAGFDPSATLSCTLQFRTLKIANGFPISVNSSYVQLVVNLLSIQNPLYSVITQSFSGNLTDSSGNQITVLNAFSGGTLQITTGSLQVQTSISPTTVHSNSTLTVTINSSHLIPQNGYLIIRFNGYWDTNAVNITQIINSQTKCFSFENTAANLYCNFTPNIAVINLAVYNLFDNDFTGLFSFTIFPFSNPSTTAPQGSFQFITFDSTANNYQIDDSSNNFISGMTTASITGSTLSLTNYTISVTATATISCFISNIIVATDLISIQFPAQINLSNLSQVVVQNFMASNLQISATNLITFQNLNINNPSTVNFVLSNFSLPAYVTTFSSFSIMTSRSSFGMDKVQNAFSLSTVSGVMSATISLSQYQAGNTANYKFQLVFEHKVDVNQTFLFSFPVQYYDFTSIIGLACLSSAKSGCVLTSPSSNQISISSAIQVSTNSVNITIKNIVNPDFVGQVQLISIQSLVVINSTSYLVDQVNSGLVVNLIARKLSNTDVTISSTSSVTYAACDLSILIKNNNFVPQNSIISINSPSQITVPSPIACSMACNFSSGVIKVTVDQDYTSKALPTITIYGIRNPKSTRPTSIFQFTIADNSNTIFEYLTSSSSIYYQSSTSTSMSVSLSRSSIVNSNNETTYTFQVSLPFDVSLQAIVMSLPNDIACNYCLPLLYNSTYYQINYQNQSTISKNVKIIQNFTNPYSLKPYVIYLQYQTADGLYKYASGSVTVQNQLPSSLYLNYSFTSRQLQSYTDITLSNFSDSKAEYSGNYNAAQFTLIFGSDINVSIASSTDYALNISSNSISFNTTLASLSLFSFSIKSILSPISSPSLPIYASISTYFNDSPYLISKSVFFYWSILCTLPCKTCSVANTSACLSCYNDYSLVSSQILLHPNNTCLSLCGDKYYQNTTDNTCKACSSQCYNCISNSSMCTSCNNGYYLLASNYTCFQTSCPIGYFIYYLTCKQCTTNLNCVSCSDSLSCDKCASGHYFYQNQCLANCPTLILIQNSYTNNCDSCPTNCTQCTKVSSTVKCNQCQNGFLLDNGGCYTSCRSVGLVPDGNQCVTCHYTCLTCIDNIYNCLTCNQSSVNRYIFQNRCLVTCPNGYYQSEVSPFTCLTCVQPCQFCSNSSVNSCQSCITTFTLYNTTCESICPQGYYQNTSKCVTCVSPCVTCLTSSICMSCILNYSLYIDECLPSCYDGYVSINKVCQNCSSNCKTCSSINYCTNCYNGTYLFQGTCVFPCPVGFFQDTLNTKYVCSQCHYTCKQCINSTACTVCTAGYELSTSLICINTCPSSYIPVSGICKICSQNCSLCQITVNNCTSCKSTFYYVPSLNKCEAECATPLRYYQTNMSCLSGCLAHQYQYSISNISGIYCFDCPQYCYSCLSDTYCTSCYNGTSFYNNLCYQTCPSQASFSISGYCKSCNVVSCYECQGISCIQCNPSHLLIGSSLCITNCSSTQVYDSVNKICKTVVNPSNSTGTISTSSTTRLNFIPLPYLIIGLLLSILTVIFHLTHRIFIIQTSIAISGIILTLCSLTTLIIYLLSQYSTKEDKIGLFLLIAGIAGTYLLNSISFYLYMKQHSHADSKWKQLALVVVDVLSLSINFKIISIYNAYFYKYISIKSQQNKPFWKKVFTIQKFSLLVNLIFIVGGLQFLFSFQPIQTEYFYYTCIELVVIALVNILLTIITTFIKINTNVPQDQNQYAVQDSLDNIGRSLDDKQNQTPFNYDEITSTYTIHPHTEHIKCQNSSVFSAKNMSEQLSPNKKVYVPNEQIENAIEKGLFREDQKQYKRKKQEADELTLLQSASKMHQANKQKDIAKNMEVEQDKELNIFQIQNEQQQNIQIGDHPLQSDDKIQEKALQKQLGNKNTPERHIRSGSGTNNQSQQNLLGYIQQKQDSQIFLNPNIIFEDFCEQNQTEFPQTQTNKSAQEQSSQNNQNFLQKKHQDSHQNDKYQGLPGQKQLNQNISQLSPSGRQTTLKTALNVKVNPTFQLEIQEIQDQIQSQSIRKDNIKNIFESYPHSKQLKQRRKNAAHRNKNTSPQILHADLQSIATVSESGNFLYSDQEEQQEQIKNVFDFSQKEQSFIVQQMEQDNRKPSQMLRVQINLLSKLRHDLPKGVGQRPKKLKNNTKLKIKGSKEDKQNK